jgi:hypothetical protein
MKVGFKGTPGPWRWELNEKSKDLNLCGGKPMYDLTVMDFVRWGVGGAIPRFNTQYNTDLAIMKKADTFGQIVPERKHHASWFKTLNHPDAQLIAAAPDLLEACMKALELSDKTLHTRFNGNRSKEAQQVYEAVSAAVSKALGGANDGTEG